MRDPVRILVKKDELTLEGNLFGCFFGVFLRLYVCGMKYRFKVKIGIGFNLLLVYWSKIINVVCTFLRTFPPS